MEEGIPQHVSAGIQDDGIMRSGALERELLDLMEKRFLERTSPEKFAFNSKLTWEVAYDAVMFSEKRRIHNQVGLYIEGQNKDNLDNVSDLLLHHFESGSNHQKTVFYAVRAGDRAARMFANTEAVNLYRRALDTLAQLAHDKPADRSLVLEKSGDVCRSSGEYQQAIENYQAAFNAWEEAGSDQDPEYLPSGYTRNSRSSSLCRKLSVAYEYASDYDNSTAWIDRAVAFLPDDSVNTASRVYAAKSATHFRKGEYEDAVNWGERALGIAKRAEDSGDIAYSHNNIANSLIHMGKLREAIVHLRKAVSLYEEKQDLMGIASANSNLGSCYMYSDNLDYAVKHYHVALDAEKRMQNDARVAIDHNNIGEVYLMRGKLDESVASFEKVIAAHDKGYAHDALAGYAMMNISRCRLQKGELDEAKDAVARSLDLIRDSGVKIIFLEARLQQASVLSAQGELEEAKRICSNTRQDIKAQGAKLLEAKAERVLAKIHAREGELLEAIEDIISSISVAKEIGSKFEEAKSLNEYARMLIEQGDPGADAIDSLSRAESIFADIGASRELAYTELLKTRLAGLTE